MRKNIKSWIIVSIIALVVVGSGITVYQSIAANQKQEQLVRWGLEGMTIVEMVETLERNTYSLNDMNARIDGTHLTIVDRSGEQKYKLPDNQFYLSFAPYISQTHPCGIHNLVTCRGELVNQSFNVIVTTQDGSIIFDEEVTSFENGFVGIWLPKGIEATIQVEFNGLVATSLISTFDNSDTCLTTPLQLIEL